jgi:hypothetical protein
VWKFNSEKLENAQFNILYLTKETRNIPKHAAIEAQKVK